MNAIPRTIESVHRVSILKWVAFTLAWDRQERSFLVAASDVKMGRGLVKRSWKRHDSLLDCRLRASPVVSLGVLSALARKPENLGVVNGRLTPCPDSPNCVSTRAEDPEHRIDPIAFDGPADQAFARLKQAIATIPRMRIVSERDGYLHAEATSLIFRFVDDVEFLVAGAEKRIDIRSASGSVGRPRSQPRPRREDPAGVSAVFE